MGQTVRKSKTQDVLAKSGNGLAIYVKADDNQVWIKDQYGQEQLLTDYINGGGGGGSNTSPYEFNEVVTTVATGSIQPVCGQNVTYGCFANIGGGYKNVNCGIASSIQSGIYNSLSTNSQSAFIGSGFTNCISASNFGFIGAGQENYLSYGLWGGIVAGNNNKIISSAYGFIGGGGNNVVCGKSASVLSGENNLATGGKSAVGSGIYNLAYGGYGFIGAGDNNCLFGSGNFIGAGQYNSVCGTNNFIGSGKYNCLNNTNFHSVIAGGYSNCMVEGYSNFIGAGFGNCINAQTYYGFILGGSNNYLSQSGDRGGILGGNSNCSFNSGNSLMGTGNSNRFCSANTSFLGSSGGSKVYFSTNAFIGSGNSNTICGSNCSSILNGQQNIVCGLVMSTIIGGRCNVINKCSYSTVIGGRENKVYSKFSSANGYINCMVCGAYNHISGRGNSMNNYFGYYVPTFNRLSGYYNYTDNGGCHIDIFGQYNHTLNTAFAKIGGSNNFICIGLNHSIHNGCLNEIRSNSFSGMIGNGQRNLICGNTSMSSIHNGCLNYIGSSTCSTILNGRGNIVCGVHYSSVLGGSNNKLLGKAYNYRNTIIGGAGNTITGSFNYYNAIGGDSNIVCGEQNWNNFVWGQQNALYDYNYGGAVFGRSNRLRSIPSSIVGGCCNNTDGAGYSIIGGLRNIATSSYGGMIFGCSNSLVTAPSSFVGGYQSSVCGVSFAGAFGCQVNNDCANSWLAYQLRGANLCGGAVNVCVNASGTIVRDTSDCRLKTNIQPIPTGLHYANLLNPVSFYWNEKGQSRGTEKQFGFIAQDVEKEFPFMVSRGNDGYLALSKDKITAINTSAIQQLTKQICGLCSYILSLQERNQL